MKRIFKICRTLVGRCYACNGTGTYDEGYGPEECTACSGSGEDQ